MLCIRVLTSPSADRSISQRVVGVSGAVGGLAAYLQMSVIGHMTRLLKTEVCHMT